MGKLAPCPSASPKLLQILLPFFSSAFQSSPQEGESLHLEQNIKIMKHCCHLSPLLNAMCHPPITAAATGYRAGCSAAASHSCRQRRFGGCDRYATRPATNRDGLAIRSAADDAAVGRSRFCTPVYDTSTPPTAGSTTTTTIS